MNVLRIHHASVIVSDTERALRIYRDLLGLKVDENRPDLGYPGAWLWIGEQQIHLLELPNPDPVDGRPAHGGRDRHLALTIDDLDALAQRLDTAGVGYTRSRSGRRALFFRDPDGNALELIEAKPSIDYGEVIQELNDAMANLGKLRSEPPKSASKPELPYCSFCGKGKNEVDGLAEGPSVYICDGCAKKAIEVMNRDG